MVINTMCGQGMQELDYIEAGEHIHANGCIDKLVNWIHSNLFLLGGIALGLAIPQVEERGAWHTHQHTHFAQALRVETKLMSPLCFLSYSWLASSCLRF